MLNPNWSKTELDRVEETLAELTPQPETFGFQFTHLKMCGAI